MHGRKGQNLKNEEVILQYEPMISSMLRQLHIHRDHDHFRQAARLALWIAIGKYDPSRGHLAPFAYRTIRGAMLDELKKEGRYGDTFTATEGMKLEYLAGATAGPDTDSDPRMDRLRDAVPRLSSAEVLFLRQLFEDRLPHAVIARTEGISVPGVKKRRERLLLKLRTWMEEEPATHDRNGVYPSVGRGKD